MLQFLGRVVATTVTWKQCGTAFPWEIEVCGSHYFQFFLSNALARRFRFAYGHSPLGTKAASAHTWAAWPSRMSLHPVLRASLGSWQSPALVSQKLSNRCWFNDREH
jgi:hypothetical protein